MPYSYTQNVLKLSYNNSIAYLGKLHQVLCEQVATFNTAAKFNIEHTSAPSNRTRFSTARSIATGVDIKLMQCSIMIC
jgi:hypothetical protein